ncbi:hypothetical protein NPIL_5871, partial [Nephila pilipes]
MHHSTLQLPPIFLSKDGFCDDKKFHFSKQDMNRLIFPLVRNKQRGAQPIRPVRATSTKTSDSPNEQYPANRA